MVALGRGDLVAQREHAREQGRERTVVGVAARVRLDRDVFGDRHVAGELCVLPADLPALDEVIEDLLGRWLEEVTGNLEPRDLGEDLAGTKDPALLILLKTSDGVANDRRGQGHESRSRDLANATLDVELGDRVLEVGLLRRVNEVAAPRRAVAKLAGKLGDRPLDPAIAKPSRAKEAEEACASGRADQSRGCDAVGHRAGHVGKADPVDLGEATVAEPLGIERRQVPPHRPPRATLRSGIGAEATTDRHSDRAGLWMANDVGGLADVGEGLGDGLAAERRRSCLAAPIEAGRNLVLGGHERSVGRTCHLVAPTRGTMHPRRVPKWSWLCHSA